MSAENLVEEVRQVASVGGAGDQTPHTNSNRPRPFTPEVFRLLADPDHYGYGDQQHLYNGTVVRKWQGLRSGKQIDLDEHRLLCGNDGLPMNCSKCGNLFQPHWVRVLRGDLHSPDLRDFMGEERSFTEDDLPKICALGRGAFKGRTIELGNFLALTWDGQVIDEGVYCGTPWFDNVVRNRTIVNNRGCLGETRNSWGEVQMQWQTAHQLGWMANRFEREMSTEHLGVLVEMIDQLENWRDPEDPEGVKNDKKPENPIQGWKDVVRLGVKKIQAVRGQSSNLFDEKLADLFNSLSKPSALQCFSRSHLDILIASKAGNSDAGRAIHRRRTEIESRAERNRIRDLIRGGRRHDTNPNFGTRLNIPPKSAANSE